MTAQGTWQSRAAARRQLWTLTAPALPECSSPGRGRRVVPGKRSVDFIAQVEEGGTVQPGRALAFSSALPWGEERRGVL